MLFTANTLIGRAQTSPFVPAQLATAKTLFVGFDGGQAADLTNQEALVILQKALIQEHRYTLVRTPTEAEISARAFLTPNGIVLSLFDTKTGALLWKITANHGGGGLKASYTKRFVRSAQEIADQLDELSAGRIPEPPK